MSCMKLHIFIILLIQLVHNAIGQSVTGAPTWSPDGKSFAYVSGTERNRDVFVYDFDKNLVSQLTFSDSSEWTPSWSPDGKYIAFISSRDGNRELYVYNFKLKTVSRLTSSAFIEGAPSWSPDSRKILFIQFNPSENSRHIFESDLNGDVVRLELDNRKSYIYPKMSSNGASLLFGMKEGEPGNYYHIWTKDLATGQLRQIEDRPGVSYNPSWSTDASKILFINQSDQDITTATIYQVNSDGSDLRQMLTCENGCFQARFSPDGKSILYKNGWGEKNTGIYLYSLESKESKVIIGVD